MKKLWAVRVVGVGKVANKINNVFLCDTRKGARDMKKKQRNLFRIIGIESPDIKVTMHRAIEGSKGVVAVYSSVVY